MKLSQNFIFWILPQPWSGTPLNERSIISSTPNLKMMDLATGNWKFILYRLRLEIQVIVLYNNKLCMFALLWQINTNLSWSTHFLLNGYLLIWYWCFLSWSGSHEPTSKIPFLQIFLCLEIGLYGINRQLYCSVMFNVTWLIDWNERYHSICSVSRNTSNGVRIWHFWWGFLIVTNKYKLYISSGFQTLLLFVSQIFGHQHAPKAAWTCPKISFFESFPSLEVGLHSMKDQLFLLH